MKRYYVVLAIRKDVTVRSAFGNQTLPFSSIGWSGVLPVFDSIDAPKDDFPSAEFFEVEESEAHND